MKIRPIQFIQNTYDLHKIAASTRMANLNRLSCFSELKRNKLVGLVVELILIDEFVLYANFSLVSVFTIYGKFFFHFRSTKWTFLR